MTSRSVTQQAVVSGQPERPVADNLHGIDNACRCERSYALPPVLAVLAIDTRGSASRPPPPGLALHEKCENVVGRPAL